MIHWLYFMNLLNSLENIKGAYLLQALCNTSFLRINVLVFVMHTEDENCYINNSYYPVVHTASATSLGREKIAMDDHDIKSDAHFQLTIPSILPCIEVRQLPRMHQTS